SQTGDSSALEAFYELLAQAARRYSPDGLQVRFVLAAGLAGTGAVQPLAATRHGAAVLAIEPDPEQIKNAVKSGYCEIMVNNLDEALRILKNAVRRREPASVGLIGDPARVVPELAGRGVVPDVVLLSPALTKDAPGVVSLQRLGAVLAENP